MGLSVVRRGAWKAAGHRGVARWAVRRPHVLSVVCPGATEVRLEAESAVAALGGRPAYSPADADVLLVAGCSGTELDAAVREAWAQMPGPRARLVVAEPGRVAELLSAAVSKLGNVQRLGREAERRDEWSATDDAATAHRTHGTEHGGHDHHGGNGGEEMPGGLPMAERAEDRDGLKLDVLHVPWGPVLPYWPAGLVLDVRMQGDVVQRVEGRTLPVRHLSGTPFWHAGGDPLALPRRVAAAHLDSLWRLLALAGWPSAAGDACRLRNRLLEGDQLDGVRAEFVPWRRRVEQSRLLRWATEGLGHLSPEDVDRLGVGGPAARATTDGRGDATARWRRWLLETDRLLGGGAVTEGGPRGRPDPAGPPSRSLLTAAMMLMPGLELTAARLLLASFDPDPDELTVTEPQTRGRAVGAR